MLLLLLLTLPRNAFLLALPLLSLLQTTTPYAPRTLLDGGYTCNYNPTRHLDFWRVQFIDTIVSTLCLAEDVRSQSRGSLERGIA